MSTSNGPKINTAVNITQGTTPYGDAMRGVLRMLQVLVQANVINQTLTIPPGSPTNGDSYVVAVGATGSWVGQDKNVAYWTTDDPNLPSGKWEFYVPQTGWQIYDVSMNVGFKFNGTSWVPITGSGVPGGASGTLQGNNSGTFSGLPGSVADFVNGLLVVSAVGTGVALRVHGDASSNRIQEWFTNATPLVASAAIDTNGSFIALKPLILTSPSGPTISASTGSPEGVLIAPVSSLYLQTNDVVGGGGLWAKGTGIGNTGWVGLFAGGANTDVQYNNNGAFGGDSNFTWDPTGRLLTVSGKMASSRSIDTAVESNPTFQNLNYSNPNTTGTSGGNATGQSVSMSFSSSSGGSGNSIVASTSAAIVSGTDAISSMYGLFFTANRSGGGSSALIQGIGVIIDLDAGHCDDMLGLHITGSIGNGTFPSITNLTLVELDGSFGSGGFAAVTNYTGLLVKSLPIPATLNITNIDAIRIEDQGATFRTAGGSPTGIGLHILTQTDGVKAIKVEGGQSQFNDTVIAQGGFATPPFTVSAAYTATSKDVAILANGTFTVTLAPFSFTLTSVTSGVGIGTYTGTITGGGSNAYAGATFTIAGFTTGLNNGLFICTASTATTLVLKNLNAATETHAATAAVTIISGQLHRVKNISSGTITVASSSNIDGLGTTILTQNQSIDVLWDGSTWWIL